MLQWRLRTQEVTTAAVDRFDRRLKEEVRALRTQVREGDTALRLEMRDLRVNLSMDIAECASSLRKDIGEVRAELFKWAFAFWVGHIVALTMIFRALQS